MLFLLTPLGISDVAIEIVMMNLSGAKSVLLSTFTDDQSPKSPVQSNVSVATQSWRLVEPSCTVTGMPELWTIAAGYVRVASPTPRSQTLTETTRANTGASEISDSVLLL